MDEDSAQSLQMKELAAKDEEIRFLKETIIALRTQVAKSSKPSVDAAKRGRAPGMSSIPRLQRIASFNAPRHSDLLSPSQPTRRTPLSPKIMRRAQSEAQSTPAREPLVPGPTVVAAGPLNSAPASAAEHEDTELVACSRATIQGHTMTFYPPRGFVPSAEDGDAPRNELVLKHVFGYRSKNVRCNLMDLPTGEVLYSVGRFCVMLQLDNVQRIYVDHTGDVRCLALSHDNATAASGQETWLAAPDSQAHVRVWNLATLATVRVLGLGMLQRAAACVAFCVSDPTLLATVDDSVNHTIVLWAWETGVPLTQTKGHTEQITAVAFNPVTHQLLTCGKQHVTFWSLTSFPDTPGRVQLVKKPGLFQNSPKARFITCLCFSPAGETVTGDSNGSIYVWEQAVPTHTIQCSIKTAHKGGVSALAATHHGFLSAGTSDGLVRIWAWTYQPYPVSGTREVNSGDVGCPLRSLSALVTEDGLSLTQFLVGTATNGIFIVDAVDCTVQPMMQSPDGHSSALACLPTLLLAVVGDCIHAWDHEHFGPVWMWRAASIAEGTQILCCDATASPANRICAALSSGVAFLDDTGTLLCVVEDIAAPAMMKFCPDGSRLAMGMDDTSVVVWDVALDTEAKLTRVCVCEGLQAQLISIDWALTGATIQAASSSAELILWDTTSGKALPAEALRDIALASYSSRFGWASAAVMAMSEPVAFVERSADGNVLLVCDDAGDLRLFKYPGYRPEAKSCRVRGHAAGITCLKLWSNNYCVTSSAQNDVTCVWQLAAPRAPAAVVVPDTA